MCQEVLAKGGHRVAKEILGGIQGCLNLKETKGQIA
jgi:hypothetical protein